MKKVLSLIVVTTLVLSLGSVFALASEVKYDALKDFSGTKNPNGVWTYAGPDGAALTEYEYGGWRIDTANGNWGGVGVNLDDNHPTIHSFIELNAGNSDDSTVGKLLFTAPEAGDYKINAFTLRVMSGSFGQQPKDFRIDVNGTNKFATAENALDFEADTNVDIAALTLTLKKGDVVAFYARSKTDGNISAYINPVITKLEVAGNDDNNTTDKKDEPQTGQVTYVGIALIAVITALGAITISRKVKVK